MNWHLVPLPVLPLFRAPGDNFIIHFISHNYCLSFHLLSTFSLQKRNKKIQPNKKLILFYQNEKSKPKHECASFPSSGNI
jgi:hypothetical protein